MHEHKLCFIIRDQFIRKAPYDPLFSCCCFLPCFAVSTGAIAQNATENAAPPAETRQDMAARAEAACPSLLRFANSFGMSHCQCLARSVTADSMDQADADLITTTLTKPGIIFRAAARNMRMGLSEEGIKAVDACTG